MLLLLVFLGACNGCQPKPPYPTDDGDTRQDTSEAPPDSAGDSTPIDTGPPARCDREEVEPNSPPDQTESLDMEVWSCGTFATYLDYDSFRISPSQSGWIKVQIEAALRGSPANPQLLIEGGGQSAQILDGYLTTDPYLVFPAETVQDYSLTLGETEFQFGEDYHWYMLTSLSKVPVDWTFEEAEPNDVYTEATPFPLSDIAFGRVSSPSDLDWYKITTTSEGEQTLVFDVTAFKEGSAADLMLVLYSADGETVLVQDSAGEIDYDRDPWFSKKFTGIQDLYLLVRTQDGRGSGFHWYTLSVSQVNE
jgi:hypothetical protein